MRHKNQAWDIPSEPLTWEQAQLAVLMDIRDELQAIRRLAECPNVAAAMVAVRRIDRRMQANGMLCKSHKDARR